MADNEPPTLWDKNTATPRSLRPPNLTSTTNILKPTNNSENKTTTDDIAAKSTLSADAAEFVPKCIFKSAPQSSVQSRLNKHKSNSSGNDMNQPPFTNSYGNSANFADINRLKQIINTLTKDPGQFDQLFDIFIDTLFPYFEDIQMLSDASEVIVDQAISHPNFRYSAARLCCAVEEQCAEFRASLHLKCQKELQSNSNKQGLLLFVAELYTQLHHDNIYGTYLIDAFNVLLKDGGNDNVKCVCQALKLTGSSLEKYNTIALDEVFNQIQALRSSVSGTALSLVDSVIALRKANWGQSSPSDTQSDHEQDGYYWGEPTGNTVFFHTDGVKISSEESDFLAANLQSNEEYLGENVYDPDELYDPEPEMDEEIQAGFKEFVKFSKR